jgi:hypothetical protein
MDYGTMYKAHLFGNPHTKRKSRGRYIGRADADVRYLGNWARNWARVQFWQFDSLEQRHSVIGRRSAQPVIDRFVWNEHWRSIVDE